MIIFVFTASFALSFMGVSIYTYKAFIRVRKYLRKYQSMEIPLPPKPKAFREIVEVNK